jgi:hypothetical protein
LILLALHQIKVMNKKNAIIAEVLFAENTELEMVNNGINA